MHGDYQFANVMFRHGAPARLAAIVDWEMATVGDPLLDLGWVIQGWLDDDDGAQPRGSYVDYTGMPSRTELLDYYARRERPADRRDRLLRDPGPLQAGRRPRGRLRPGGAGEADNPKMEAFGDVVLDLAATGRRPRPPTTSPPLRVAQRRWPPGPGGST